MKELDKMLFELFKTNKTAIIPYQQIVDSFPKKGVKYDMGKGKWVELVELKENSILIKCFMPKGTYYTNNVHFDADEIVTVITGYIENKNFRLKKKSMGQFGWKAGVVHDLKALEDSLFYALLTKI